MTYACRLLLCFLALLSLRTPAATLLVTTLADNGAGSFRTALSNAHDGDVIAFDVLGTITNLSGELLITKNLAVVGPGPTKLAICGKNSTRVLNIAPGAAVTISAVTICDGHAPNGAHGTNSVTPGGPGEDGGGIYNAGALSLTNCVITRCQAGDGGSGHSDPFFPSIPGSSDGGPGGNGGGICNLGTLLLANCSLLTNASGKGGHGGAPWNNGPGSAGAGAGNGGGIFNLGDLSAFGCTFGFNNASAGGGGGAGGAGNGDTPDGEGGGRGGGGGSGGAVYSQNGPSFVSCTFAGNSAGAGGEGGRGGAGDPFLSLLMAGNGGSGGEGGEGGSGGGLYCLGAFQAIACTIAGNAAGNGGRAGQGGAGSINRRGGPGGSGGNGGNGGNGGSGGGAFSWAGSTLRNVLCAQNFAGTGGTGGLGGAGGMGMPPGSNGSPGSSGLSGSGRDLFGAFTSQGYNLIGLDEGHSGFTHGIMGDIVGTGTTLDPGISPLGNNGGPTSTCALLSGSPALDSGDDTLLNTPLGLTTDQRGVPRLLNQHIDIGAYELRQASTPLLFATCSKAIDGAVRLTLTNLTGTSLTVLSATNAFLPSSAWTPHGYMSEIADGQFEFLDTTNVSRRFYRLRSP